MNKLQLRILLSPYHPALINQRSWLFSKLIPDAIVWRAVIPDIPYDILLIVWEFNHDISVQFYVYHMEIDSVASWIVQYSFRLNIFEEKK